MKLKCQVQSGVLTDLQTVEVVFRIEKPRRKNIYL
jgi:ribosomal protein S25